MVQDQVHGFLSDQTDNVCIILYDSDSNFVGTGLVAAGQPRFPLGHDALQWEAPAVEGTEYTMAKQPENTF